MLPLVETGRGIPGLDLSFIMALLLNFMVLMVRLGAFVATAPLFSARFVPLQIRVIFAAALSLALLFSLEAPPIQDFAGLSLIWVILTEIFIGASMGFVLAILLAAAVFAGDRIAATAGLSFAAQFDPTNGGSTPVLAQIFGLAMLAIFVGSDAHLQVLDIVLHSYILLPPGEAFPLRIILTAGLESASNMFATASQIMIPIVGLLSLVNVVIGVITRSAPQLNLFSFGFPATMMATIVLLYMTAPSIIDALGALSELSVAKLANIFEELHNGRR